MKTTETSLENTIIQRIKMLMKDSETPTAFARRCGVPQTTISTYLNNHSRPRIDILLKIAQANDKSLDWFVGKAEKTPENDVIPLQSITYDSESYAAMEEVTGWIREQDDPGDYWSYIKIVMKKEFPDFKDWLKKRQRESSGVNTPQKYIVK